jgi:PLP dependent protein
MSVDQNIQDIQRRIAAAAEKAGRSAHEIALMAVSKTFGPARIREAYAAGLRLFGENRVQEFAGKAPQLADLKGVEWHMVGHLQSNKVNRAVELFAAVDSIDSVRLAERLNSAAAERGTKIGVLIEVNVGGEAAKSGMDPESQELDQLLEAAPQWPHVMVQGLMTVPPFTEDPEQARPHFRRVRELRDRIAGKNLGAVRMDTLSMGMSHDFEIAIEEGSTCVRLGTAIFGDRRP